MTVVSFSMAYRSFRGGAGRLDTRLGTPPSINRRHPDSRLAPALPRADFPKSMLDLHFDASPNRRPRPATAPVSRQERMGVIRTLEPPRDPQQRCRNHCFAETRLPQGYGEASP